uniref:Uncharacterized protein n=1 Tax=Arundo donax TaxID=35708 RepID=A0A0A9DW39_ARUDO
MEPFFFPVHTIFGSESRGEENHELYSDGAVSRCFRAFVCGKMKISNGTMSVD